MTQGGTIPVRSTDGSPAPEPTRTLRRAAATRRAVIDAAREIVATGGIESLTLEAVSEHADVAVATIYNRVGNRSALLVAVAEQAMEECRTSMDAAYSSVGSAEERLQTVAAAYARFARERPHEFQLLVEPADEPAAVAPLARLAQAQNAKLADVLRDAVASGEARPDLDPDLVATALWAALNGVLALSWRPGGLRVEPPALDALLSTFLATVADGLRTRPG